jgi:uncharacterized protein
MKRLFSFIGLVLVLASSSVAQTSVDDSPATREDMERYLEVTHSRDMMKKTVATMTQSVHLLMHDQYLKHKGELPADYESKISSMVDTMFENMPMDEMMQAMIPAYQKHLTKGDLENLVAFYSSPTGAKLLRELPDIMAEAMQDMMPIMSRYMETVQQKLLKETNDMIAQSKKKAAGSTPAINN